MAILAVACNVEEIVDPNEGKPVLSEDETFYAYTEARSDEDASRVYVDPDATNNKHTIRWNKDDRITIFNKKTSATEYAFTGEDGSTEGAFAKIENGNGAVQGDAMPVVYAIYPHSGETAVHFSEGATDGTISFNLPATQNYLQNASFGKDANVMVARTDNNVLFFKSAVGYLVLKLYSSRRSVSVSSITLESNNTNEYVAGPCSIDMSGMASENGAPSLTMTGSEGSTNKIRLFCKEVVPLSTSSADCKEFWFALPPMTFSGGFKITVATSDGGVYTKSTTKELTIERNKVKRMAAIQVSATGDNTLQINNLSTIYGKYEQKNTQGELIFDEDDQTILLPLSYEPTYDSSTRTYTFTMPTFTDFTQFKMSFSIPDDTELKADDQVIVSNETMFDVTHPVSLAVCKKNANNERRYTLVVRNTGLPVVRITTEGFTQRDLEKKEKKKENGEWIDERKYWPSTEVPGIATFHIDNADGSVNLDHAPMTIKGRGNASWKYKKRPFAIKLNNKEKVLGMKKSKHWILLANWKDRTLLRNDAAFWLSKKTNLTLTTTDPDGTIHSEKVGLPYTVSGEFVELEFNGVHRGNYYLCEKVRIEDSRVKLTKIEDNEVGTSDPYLITGPYIMEIDNNYDEEFKFISGFYGPEGDPHGMKYMFKDPDESISTEAFNYMKSFIMNLEEKIKAIPSGDYSYRDILDIDSAIWFMFVNELTGNGDFFNTDNSNPAQNQYSEWYGPHSTYMYKDRAVKNEDGTSWTETKLFMGPVWDFDYLTFYDKSGNPSRSNKWVGVAESNYYYYYFTQDPVFRARTKELWRAYKLIIADAMLTYIDGMKMKLALSEPINTAMWGYTGTDQNQNGDNTYNIDKAVTEMKKAFTKKLTFMNTEIENDDYRN